MARKTSKRKFKSVTSLGPKACYVRLRASLTPGGSAPISGEFDFVRSLVNATRFSPDDASNFKRRASEWLPPVRVEIEEAGDGKYILREA
jgi:hypothetical protein